MLTPRFLAQLARVTRAERTLREAGFHADHVDWNEAVPVLHISTLAEGQIRELFRHIERPYLRKGADGACVHGSLNGVKVCCVAHGNVLI
ncbi:hypothetical protein G3O06_20595 [Burkholderia sp. Ac-20345]|uniref:hypothetical protein n=1 Tax=Burkholderia sp. Ac-20345 TaxID=2703891 RepID=UPI00197B41D2|nr:hypothetical protein [Burkholderia sp. Ac-20345]MBN3779939.1 hypothetical protein [Burkholderia sp. Ac-20345]